MTNANHKYDIWQQALAKAQRYQSYYLAAVREFEAGDDTLNADWDRRHAVVERQKEAWHKTEDDADRAHCEWAIALRRQQR
jgi:hypothetical protein